MNQGEQDLEEIRTTRTVNFSVKDVSSRIPEMEATLARLRRKKGVYRSELVRFAVRYLYLHPELLRELADNPR